MVRYYNYIVLGQDVSVLAGKKVVIWGISASGLNELICLKAVGAIVKGFTDSFVTEKGNYFASYPIMTFNEIMKEVELCIVISTRNVSYLREILSKCEKIKSSIIYAHEYVYGPWQYDISKMRKMIEDAAWEIDFVRGELNDDKSIATFDNLLQYRLTNNQELINAIYEREHLQYFPGSNVLKKSEQEVFIDAGAYNGDTSVRFSEWVNKQYKKIYLMEPDPLMFEVSKAYVNMKKISCVNFVNKAAYSENTSISFTSDSISGSSRVDNSGECKIETITIDDMLDGECATYIKMDIEGVEYEALKGCARTIERYHPKLAISIYHKDSDLWNIPYYLMKNYPEYKFYIRHYTDITTETILYAGVE